MIENLVLFGATGDLAGRYLLPALAALHAAGELPETFTVVGAATADWDDRAFRRHAEEWLNSHASDVPDAARQRLLDELRYRQVDLADADSVARVLDAAGTGPVATYLALPPALFPLTIATLGEVGLPDGSRVAVEKPFGEDLEGAVELNSQLAELAGTAGEDALFRVDHVLGMSTVQNLVALRLANRTFEPLWNSEHIEQIEVLWEETLALEGRAGYYDSAGALKDVLQNHMLQVLALLAMEPPATLDERDVRDAQVAALRSLRAPAADQMGELTRRARYGAGRIGDRAIPAYVDEEGVDPSRGTETFAELELTLEVPRWEGTRVVLRAGKALGRRRKAAIVRFRPVTGPPFAAHGLANELQIGVDGPEDIVLTLAGRPAGADAELAAAALEGSPPSSGLPAYANVLRAVLKGEGALSVRGDEAEAAWRVVAPVLDAWAHDRVPLEEYPAGSDGPLSADASGRD